MTEEMTEDLLKIIYHYGVNKQLKYIHSEYFELDEAIMQYTFEDKSSFTDREHIAEEIADITVMIKQFQYYYDISDEQIEKIMKKKIKRQIERIENEQSK